MVQTGDRPASEQELVDEGRQGVSAERTVCVVGLPREAWGPTQRAPGGSGAQRPWVGSDRGTEHRIFKAMGRIWRNKIILCSVRYPLRLDPGCQRGFPECAASHPHGDRILHRAGSLLGTCLRWARHKPAVTYSCWPQLLPPASQVLKWVESAVQASKVHLLSTDHEEEGEHTWKIPLDPSLKEVTISLSGPGPQIEVRDPLGTCAPGPASSLVPRLSWESRMGQRERPGWQGVWTQALGTRRVGVMPGGG